MELHKKLQMEELVNHSRSKAIGTQLFDFHCFHRGCTEARYEMARDLLRDHNRSYHKWKTFGLWESADRCHQPWWR